MKKFLYCFIFLIAFSGISSVILNASGFDGSNRQIKSEIASYQELTDKDKEDLNLNTDDKVNNLNKTKIVYDVILFEFSDYRGYFNNHYFEDYDRLFNEYDLSNNFYSVNEYFKDISYGQVEINANFMLYKDDKPRSYYENSQTLFQLEYATYQKAKIKSTSIYKNYGEANASMTIFAGKRPESTSNRLWAHAYVSSTYVSLTDEAATVGTIVHEILHTFGLKDLYTYAPDLPTPVFEWDTSANGASYLSNNLMYSKLNANWVSVSDYGDDKQTEIETIAESGTYTIYPTTSTTGTRAYKFGIKKGDKKVYFMAEYRKSLGKNRVDSKIGEGLIVYRVNENRKLQGNLVATTYKDFEIFVYRPKNLNYPDFANLNSPDSVCGSLTDSSYYLYYEDKTIAKYIIDNVNIDNENGTLTFNFTNYEDKTNYIAGKVFDEKSKPLANVDIYIDSIKATTTNDKGEFIITNITKPSTLLVVSSNSSLTYNPIQVNPGEISIKIYSEAPVFARLSVAESTKSETFNLYRFEDNKWIQVDTFKGGTFYVVIKNAKTGQKYKVTGNLVDEEFIIDSESYFKNIRKKTPKKEEEKSTTEKITDTITSIPGKVKSTLEGVYNTAKDSISSAIDGFARWLGF